MVEGDEGKHPGAAVLFDAIITNDKDRQVLEEGETVAVGGQGTLATDQGGIAEELMHSAIPHLTCCFCVRNIHHI
jgi:hypothetical protein